MLVLALDTTTRTGSCALVRDETIVCVRQSSASMPPAARLPGELMDLLTHSAVPLADVDVYAVATGPGSFTGLRVGIATMQGLAFAAGKPLIGISAFDALAAIGRTQNERALRPGDLVATWVDAWRGEVYAALYRDGREIDAPAVTSPTAWLKRRLPATLFIGDGAMTYADTILEAASSARIGDPATPALAGAIGQLAAAAARAGYAPRPDAIRPLYVRRPDAEIARDAR